MDPSTARGQARGWTRRGALAAVLAMAVCLPSAAQPTEPPTSPLRVGVTPDYPPMVFRVDGKLVGVEVEFARRLGRELNRPVRFVEMNWVDQIPALVARRTDIIMSGMTATQERMQRISFSESYYSTGFLALIRAEDYGRFASVDDIVRGFLNVGVLSGTTGQAFVRSVLPEPRVAALQRTSDASVSLLRQEIDVFIHDAPAVIWAASESEGRLVAVALRDVRQQSIAWGVRRDDAAMLEAVNAALARWREDGTLDTVLGQWLPRDVVK